MKTYMANPDKIERKWYVVDASEYTLGRLAPKGPLGRTMIKKLHVYAGPEHAQQAQKPVELKF